MLRAGAANKVNAPSSPYYGFAGDPNSPSGGRYYGYLAYAAGTNTHGSCRALVATASAMDSLRELRSRRGRRLSLRSVTPSAPGIYLYAAQQSKSKSLRCRQEQLVLPAVCLPPAAAPAATP